MIIDCISDLHGHYPELEGGDLLIVAGDLTARDTQEEYMEFDDWIYEQNYMHKIVIAGNHDNKLMCDDPFLDGYLGITPEYLCDSGLEIWTEYEITKWGTRPAPNAKKLKIWGSPWTKWFEGVNPHCTAFMLKTEEELAEKWAMIPSDTDILITHSPPKGILDWNKHGKQCGSDSLWERSKEMKNLKLFVFGHIHEAYSMINTSQLFHGFPEIKAKSLPIIVNASHVNERYEPVNKPVRVIL